MMESDTQSLIVVGRLLVLGYGLCVYVLKRFWIDKRPVSPGLQATAESVYEDVQNSDKRRAHEEVRYIRDEENQLEESSEEE